MRAEPSQHSSTGDLAGKRIFWLEDDPFFVGKMVRMFREKGDQIEQFETVPEFRERMATIGPKDLVVVDLLVPGGEDGETGYAGLEVLKDLAKLPAKPPILVFSVVTDEDVVDQVKRYTPHVLHKPIQLHKFEEKVSSLLSQISNSSSEG